MWEDPGGLPGGGRSHTNASAQQLFTTSPSDDMVPTSAS